MANALTSTLIVRLLDQVTGPAKTAGRSLVGLDKAAKGVIGSFGQRLGAAVTKNNAALAETRGSLFDAVAGFYALKAAIGGPVRAAMEFESAMADVRKVVDFPTPDGLKQFSDQLLDMSKRVPIAVTGLAAIAAAAGQAGVPAQDLVKFTELVAKASVAFDMTADKSGDALAKIRTGLGLTTEQLADTADAINALSNAGASSAPDLVDFIQRVGPLGKIAGYTTQQMLALGSVMVSAGVPVEIAATTFEHMTSALGSGTSATKGQRKAFKALGMDAGKVSKAMQKDAIGTTNRVLAAINKLPKNEQGAIIAELFGKEAKGLPLLTSNGKLVADTLAVVSDKTKYAGSVQAEFDQRAKTTANTLQLLGNRTTALGVAVGNALLPTINAAAIAIGPYIDKLTALATAYPDLTKNVMLAVGSIFAFKIAVTGLKFIGLLGRGGALSMLTLGFNTVGRAAIGATRAAKGAVGLQTALAAMSGLKVGSVEKIGIAIRAMAFAIPGIAPLAGILAGIGTGLAAISAPVWGVALGVAALGFAAWKYSAAIAAFASGFGSRIAAEFPVASAAIGDFASKVVSYLDFSPWITKAVSALQEFGTWLSGFFVKDVLTGDQTAAWSAAGANLAGAMVDGIKTAINGLVDWFSGLGSRILSAIGSIDLTSAFHWPSFGLGGSDPAASHSPTIIGTDALNDNNPSGHRARGGNVWSGGSFLVGENEPEIFSPRSGGTITPASKAAGGVRVTFGDIHVHGNGDPIATAREVSRVLNQDIRRALDGINADLGAYS